MTSAWSRRQACRWLMMAIGATALAACQTRAPVREPVLPPAPEVKPAPGVRNKVALIVPLSGENRGVGTSLANAARLALIDTADESIQLSVYDSAKSGAAVAASQAAAEGNELIIGPLLAEEVRAVAPIARKAGVPVIAFSNDQEVAGDGVFIMGTVPAQSIERIVRFARGRGAARFAALAPTGVYGQRTTRALLGSVQRAGGQLGAIQTFDRTAASVRTAVTALNAKGPFDAVLIADSGRGAAMAAPLIRPGARILGTELWGNDRALGATAALRGAWYAALPNDRFDKLVIRYRARFGKTPYRLASLGYDAMLLTVRTAKYWQAGRAFPARRLIARDGFSGVDGIFRFGGDGIAERALEVRQVTAAGSTVVSPAAAAFSD